MNPSGSSTALSADLNSFIYGVSRRNLQNASELTKIGISLLKTFPAARDAVLEYFAMVFHSAVNVSINPTDYENDPSTTGALESVNMIGPELCSLGDAWAPFIAPWCINLIMDIATQKENVPSGTLQSTEPIRILLDITAQNLTLLDTDMRAKCIDMMLGCRACPWAVGWIGRAEPALVAPRALALGADAVLAQLAQHPPAALHVRAALRDLFQEAITSESPEKQRDVIPYLLNLASKSDIVLKAITQDIEEILTEAVIERLDALWRAQRGGGGWQALGAGALVALLARAHVRCALLLLHHAVCRPLLEYLLQKLELEGLLPESDFPLLASAAEEAPMLRERLLEGNQLEQYTIARLLILVSCRLPSEYVNTMSYLLQYSRNETTLALFVRIMSGTITMHVPTETSERALGSVERYQEHVRAAVAAALRGAMLSDTQIKRCFVQGQVPKDAKTYLHHFCLNIIKLLRWENSNRVSHLRSRPVARAVEASLCRFADALLQAASLLHSPAPCTMAELGEMPTCHALAEVLDRIDLTGTKGLPPSVEAILKVVKATVLYFFRCLHEEDVVAKVRGVQTACRLLRKLCAHSKLARAAALRDLLETAMFREDQAFGSKSFVNNTAVPRDWRHEELLLHQNQKHGPITQLTQSHTSVFHAGIIGKGVRKQNLYESKKDIPPILTTNNELLMGALMSCMEGNSNTGIVEGCTSVALLLVELVSPDVMYNGLPWPDEDFTKQVSIERELYMRSALESSAVARAALRRCAAARPALCLASALLRAAAATAAPLHRLATLHADSQSPEIVREKIALRELLETMTLGQLLPHPLSHMLDMVPNLTAIEIVQILRDCLWNYTRDNVPSPALFIADVTGLHWRDPATCQPARQYTDTLRGIIQSGVKTHGHLYPLMFMDLKRQGEGGEGSSAGAAGGSEGGEGSSAGTVTGSAGGEGVSTGGEGDSAEAAGGSAGTAGGSAEWEGGSAGWEGGSAGWEGEEPVAGPSAPAPSIEPMDTS